MIHDKKVIVVMPAYNAEQTLEITYKEIPPGFIDEVILVDAPAPRLRRSLSAWQKARSCRRSSGRSCWL